MAQGHGPSLAEWRAGHRAQIRQSAGSLFSRHGRLTRAVKFARRDGRDRVEVNRNDLAAALRLARWAAANQPTGRAETDAQWRRDAERFLREV